MYVADKVNVSKTGISVFRSEYFKINNKTHNFVIHPYDFFEVENVSLHFIRVLM